MPQIGWLEILTVVIISILVLGPKEFPIALKKIGSYIGKIKSTFSNLQREVSSVTDKIDIEKDISKEDLDTWKDYIKNPTDVIDKDSIVKKNNYKSFRYRFDLHGYTLLDANKKIEDLIIFCTKNNYKEILLITGKGTHSKTDNDIYVSKNLSKLKYSVPDFIKSNLELSKYVSSISNASNLDGGEGAMIIKLKKL